MNHNCTQMSEPVDPSQISAGSEPDSFWIRASHLLERCLGLPNQLAANENV